MFLRTVPLTISLLCLATTARAQPPLKLINPGEKTIVLSYLARNLRPRPMKHVELAPRQTVSVPLEGDDPFDVSLALKSESDQPSFQMKVGPPDGVALKSLAANGRTLEIRLTLAAKKRNGRVLGQVMSATLYDENTDSDTRLISAPGEASDFVSEILGREWDTEFVAGNGQTTRATLDFDNLIFRTNRFSGVFHDLAAFEDEAGCRLVGRWSAQGSQGNVYFSVRRDSPMQLDGEYTFDGRRDRLMWSSVR